jgi:hypothetical protein
MDATKTSEWVEASPNARRTPHSSFLMLFISVLCALGPGCTHYRLEVNTVKQAQTVVDLEYRQILDNLAMFCLNREALPSLVTLKTGASQVGDTGSAGFLGTSGLTYGSPANFYSSFGSSPTITGTRTIVDQWGSSPVTDDNNLLLLQKAFRCALGWKDLINEDDANDLAHDLNPQIGTTADISVDRDTLGTVFSQNVISSVLARFMPPEPARKNPPPGTSADVDLYWERRRQLDNLAGRFAEVSELIDSRITDTLDHEILAQTYAFRYSRRLDVVPVNDVSEIPATNEDRIWVAAVRGGLRIRIFDSDGKRSYDIQLMPSIRDLSETPPNGTSLIIAAYRNSVPYLRIFGADGKRIDHTITEPDSRIALLAELRDELDRPVSKDLTDSEKNRIITAVVALADPCALDKIKDIITIYDNSKPPKDVEWKYKRELIKKVVEITGLKSSLKKRFEPFQYASTGLAKETIYRLNDAQKTLDEIRSGWVHWGPKKPKDACYVGHARFCGREMYVWVCDDGLDGLSNFTRAVLKLGSTFKDVQVITAPTGIQFSPALTNAPR